MSLNVVIDYAIDPEPLVPGGLLSRAAVVAFLRLSALAASLPAPLLARLLFIHQKRVFRAKLGLDVPRCVVLEARREEQASDREVVAVDIEVVLDAVAVEVKQWVLELLRAYLNQRALGPIQR